MPSKPRITSRCAYCARRRPVRCSASAMRAAPRTSATTSDARASAAARRRSSCAWMLGIIATSDWCTLSCVRALGIDYGRRRIGLALSDATGMLARPWKTIAVSGGADARRGGARARDRRARSGDGRPVGGRVGYPRQPQRRADGTDGAPSRRSSRAFERSSTCRSSSRTSGSAAARPRACWRARKGLAQAQAAARRGLGGGHPAGLSRRQRARRTSPARSEGEDAVKRIVVWLLVVAVCSSLVALGARPRARRSAPYKGYARREQFVEIPAGHRARVDRPAAGRRRRDPRHARLSASRCARTGSRPASAGGRVPVRSADDRARGRRQDRARRRLLLPITFREGLTIARWRSSSRPRASAPPPSSSPRPQTRR